MKKRKLGKSKLAVPVICLGTNVYGWTLSEADSFRQLDAAVDVGLTFVDTADAYSWWVPGNRGGESETILGKWFVKSDRRKDVILATKVGSLPGGGNNLRATHIAQAAEDSLRRLETDYIDLYQAHFDDDKVPLEETLRAFDSLVSAGKVRYIGASNYSGARLAETIEVSRSLGLAEYVSLQPHYNLVERHTFETDLLAVVEKYELGVLPYFSLAAGFLSGKYRSKEDAATSERGSMVLKYLNDWGFGVADVLEQVAHHHNATPAQVALAWLIAQPGVTAPIASATSGKQLQDLVAATQLNLDAEAIETLNAVSTPQTFANA